jgi:hypothetical protein
MRLKTTDVFMALTITGLGGLIFVLAVLVLRLLPVTESDNLTCYRSADGKIGCKPTD